MVKSACHNQDRNNEQGEFDNEVEKEREVGKKGVGKGIRYAHIN